jgi:alkylhydroperoxidase family enzyme
MARIPFTDPSTPGLAPLVDRIVAERGELLDLYRMLLHSPPIAEGWRALMTAVRQQTSLPATSREIIIIRIAHLNGASYEAEQHIPIALNEGLTQAQVEALVDWERAALLFADPDRAALALTDQMTRQVRVDDAVWNSVRALWPDREIVELIVTIASYNMVSRFLEALEIRARSADS